jgi:Toprim domain-containing protein
MTRTLAGADIRGYHAALGVQIPDWARTEATVRCFADPDTHRRADHDPSCSVSLEHGAWHCHACGAKGGAFDAARVRGYSDRGAIDFMVAYGLTEHRAYRQRNAEARPTPESISTRPAKSRRAPLRAIERDIDRWQAALAADTDLIAKLSRGRGWLYATMLELELGVDRGRITIPVRDDACRLVALLRYQPWPQPGEPKMLATAGSRRALLPHPAAEPSTHVLLVEGEPDMIAARSHGLPAIAVPGVDAWRPGWAQLLAGREVTVIMDCDERGRAAAAAIESDLSSDCAVRVLDLAPDRNDGYDVTDWLLERQRSVALAIDDVIASTGDSGYARR